MTTTLWIFAWTLSKPDHTALRPPESKQSKFTLSVYRCGTKFQQLLPLPFNTLVTFRNWPDILFPLSFKSANMGIKSHYRHCHFSADWQVFCHWNPQNKKQLYCTFFTQREKQFYPQTDLNKRIRGLVWMCVWVGLISTIHVAVFVWIISEVRPLFSKTKLSFAIVPAAEEREQTVQWNYH